MENIIYNELLIRDYTVDVGETEVINKIENNKYQKANLEIDFVINKGNKKLYIQSAFDIPTIEKEAQEKRSLIKINDSFKKIIIVKNNIIPKIDENGIHTISLKDFLFQKDILEN